MISDSNEQALLTTMSKLSAADLSILEAALAKADESKCPSESKELQFGRRSENRGVSLMTETGSPNHHLWSEFERQGWMREQDLPDFLLGSQARSYLLLFDGVQPITNLFNKLVSLRVDPRLSAMTAILNGLCREFVKNLVTSVKSAGGDGQDIATLMSITVAAAIKDAAKPGHYEDVLDIIVAAAKSHLRAS